MAVLCRMLTIQYSSRSARLSVHKLFTYCIRLGLVSRDSIVDGDWLPALCDVLSTRVGRRRKFGEVSCTECARQGNDFESIPRVEMETIHPVHGCLFW